MRLHAGLYGVQSDLVAPRMQQVMEMVGLWERRDGQVRTFSGGMRRRLEIARPDALAAGPVPRRADDRARPPDAQLDLALHRRAAPQRGHHDLPHHALHGRAELCDRIAIMDKGEIVVLDNPEALKASVGADRVRIQTDDEAAIAEIGARYGFDAAVSEGAVTFAVESGAEFVPRLFAELKVPIHSVSVSRPTLDDVFMRYTGSTIRDAEEDQSRASNRIAARMMGVGR